MLLAGCLSSISITFHKQHRKLLVTQFFCSAIDTASLWTIFPMENWKWSSSTKIEHNAEPFSAIKEKIRKCICNRKHFDDLFKKFIECKWRITVRHYSSIESHSIRIAFNGKMLVMQMEKMWNFPYKFCLFCVIIYLNKNLKMFTYFCPSKFFLFHIRKFLKENSFYTIDILILLLNHDKLQTWTNAFIRGSGIDLYGKYLS